ncbi:MAG: DUF4386 domain-containing protein, partial [Devosia sp.]
MKALIVLTGVLLIVVPVAFNFAFFALRRSFDYPEILRRPAGEILERFGAGGRRLRATWYGFAFTALLFIPVPVLVYQLFPEPPWYLLVGTTLGVIAGVLQTIGLMRWPFVVPVLVRALHDPDATPAHKDAVEVIFEAFHRFVGEAIGEHLGYLLTAAWTIIVGIAIIETHLVSPWLA